jgi:hypothetical protein
MTGNSNGRTTSAPSGPTSTWSSTVLTSPKHRFRSTQMNGHHRTGPAGPFGANRRHNSITSSAIYRSQAGRSDLVYFDELSIGKLRSSRRFATITRMIASVGQMMSM